MDKIKLNQQTADAIIKKASHQGFFMIPRGYIRIPELKQILNSLVSEDVVICLCGLDVRDCGGCMDGELMPKETDEENELTARILKWYEINRHTSINAETAVNLVKEIGLSRYASAEFECKMCQARSGLVGNLMDKLSGRFLVADLNAKLMKLLKCGNESYPQLFADEDVPEGMIIGVSNGAICVGLPQENGGFKIIADANWKVPDASD